ncbi:MAG: hypothetical protein A3C80_01220 [Candidatus Ryanbacteria bacterium RIFCSPHIGHO2_02_FULL_45_43]|uniref:Uncharacterized protein n=1 Tax=Candidatus Ryanbacteria bacterium RIFCSPHIGHO2_01_45_13 TaxID=1802112 RepID=A0A1G2FZ66_9BACT|nr:MAG: hypothetical protein A2718_03450 [Candidatus Ryanbacteria bacterium RIFCSPHIGHO2_01_FULL_44_130]OGZ42861.1 MAG: hypothetical protein A2W41_01925 [Candidatus Ryanbacteria bacterium RIFCSPHIGHO2_01_45_13]OGZ48145.1 MAG: hypothetical protein A3C80_01220 [Candidatus Ryanbacteria bacterium RIFCSPHIGHO2_02_FULL_45_43]OGZ49792.1 MAG: hypothetical protein A3E55_01045 [Candidatus Ryanbacteria bacterium RIFCSPHIGHO2_12_FULL_44_20]OGZ51219.1 MAG: hypothetical protein A3A17_04255 [Candidatus Ryanba
MRGKDNALLEALVAKHGPDSVFGKMLLEEREVDRRMSKWHRSPQCFIPWILCGMTFVVALFLLSFFVSTAILIFIGNFLAMAWLLQREDDMFQKASKEVSRAQLH